MPRRKRPSGDYPLPPAKQRRLVMRTPTGASPSPGGSHDMRDRWVSHVKLAAKATWTFALNTVDLVHDTLLAGPTLPTNVSTATSTDSSASSAAPPPSTPPTSAESETDPTPPLPVTFCPPPRPPLVPWPTTADTKTYYPQVDRELRNTLRAPQKRKKRRPHIFANQHKAQVEAARAGIREDTLKRLYLIKQQSGYSSDFSTFKGLMKKQAMIQRYLRSRTTSITELRTRASPDDDDTEFLRRALQKAQATLDEPKPLRPLTPSISQLQFRYRTKDGELERRLWRPLPTSLPPEDDAQVDSLLRKQGVISKYAKEQVTDQDILRLRPGKWLNDEIINFYGALVLGRSDDCKENSWKGAKDQKPLNVHYFSTFFWSKLEKEGYDKGRLAKWTKKIDIFSKDVILIPVNHANIHWTAAAINFRRKRIESYDSMLDDRSSVFKLLRRYLDQEHRNKKKVPFDFTDWEDYMSKDTPRQENGFDCGVFTCQFLESLSRGQERFNFMQKDIPYLRRRMIWEIGNATLGTEYE